MNRQMYIPLTTIMTRKGEPLEQGKISFMHARMKDIKRHKEAVGGDRAHPLPRSTA